MYDGPVVLNDFDEDERRDINSNDWGAADALLPAEDIPVDPDLVETPDSLAGRKDAPRDARDACYACLTTLFPCPPGIREEETRRQFFARVEAGYRPEDIVDGARKYLASPNVAPSEKWRYPLKWLSDDGAFAAFVHRAPERPLEAMPARERAMAAKFSRGRTDRESMWTVREKGGMPMEVDCDPGCTEDEARAAFERQLLREQREECGEEW